MIMRKSYDLKAKKLPMEKRYKVIIRPAVLPVLRHRIEDAVKRVGFKVTGGGTTMDMSECDFDMILK
jgi:hypothetical protein